MEKALHSPAGQLRDRRDEKVTKREHNDPPAALAVTIIVDVLFLSFLSVYTNQMPLVFL